MSNLIPNENSWVGFVAATVAKPDGLTNYKTPTSAEVAAAIDLTDFIVTINASASGNPVPTPRLKSLFETTIPGTSSATFTADMYRDDQDDLAWDTLYRGRRGVFLISRFGGTGPARRPAATQKLEVWPVQIISRAGAALQSGSAQMFTLTASVPKEPAEDAVVAA